MVLFVKIVNDFQSLTILGPSVKYVRYAHVRRGLEMLVFRKILRTYFIDGPFSKRSDV